METIIEMGVLGTWSFREKTSCQTYSGLKYARKTEADLGFKKEGEQGVSGLAPRLFLKNLAQKRVGVRPPTFPPLDPRLTDAFVYAIYDSLCSHSSKKKQSM